MKNHILYTFDPFDDYPWEKSVQESYADGCRIFSFLYPLMIAWQEDGSYDFTLLDQLVSSAYFGLIVSGVVKP